MGGTATQRRDGDLRATQAGAALGIRSSVDLCVLAVVLEMPSHGYDIGRRFVERYQGLFASTIPHVYKALDRLEEKALVLGSVNPEGVSQRNKPTQRQPKRFYRVSPDGARRCHAWLTSAISPIEARREMWVRLRTVRKDDFTTMLRVLDSFEQTVLTSAGFLRDSPGEDLVDRLAREDHEAAVEQQLRWLGSAREHVLHDAERRGVVLP